MSRSQRHMVRHTNYSSDCRAVAEGAIATGYLLQGAGPYTVPVGPAGGPLKGSTLSGPVPATFPGPKETDDGA